MKVNEFEYQLPQEFIAKQPLKDRDTSRLMLLHRNSGRIAHHMFSELPDLLRATDVMVLNNTLVFPARLLGYRLGLTSESRRTGGNLRAQIEVLLVKQVEEDVWDALVKPGRKIRIGEQIHFGTGELRCVVLGRGPRGLRRLRFDHQEDFEKLVDKLGHVPLPPYIARPDTVEDRYRYQTVYAKKRGAVAAPTAGLHFTQKVLDQLEKKGIQIREITLHVGPGTFQPVRSEIVEEHAMEAERFEISSEAAETIRRAKTEGKRIIAVGTTVARALESVATRHAGVIVPEAGETTLFIYPGYAFHSVDGLLTNFHLPRSTLLMLVSAFAGLELVREAYKQAIERRYRFYSYGDCMLIL